MDVIPVHCFLMPACYSAQQYVSCLQNRAALSPNIGAQLQSLCTTSACLQERVRGNKSRPIILVAQCTVELSAAGGSAFIHRLVECAVKRAAHPLQAEIRGSAIRASCRNAGTECLLGEFCPLMTFVLVVMMIALEPKVFSSNALDCTGLPKG